MSHLLLNSYFDHFVPVHVEAYIQQSEVLCKATFFNVLFDVYFNERGSFSILISINNFRQLFYTYQNYRDNS